MNRNRTLGTLLLLSLFSLAAPACGRDASQAPPASSTSAASAPVNAASAPTPASAAAPTPAPAAAGELAVGKPAPDFTAKAHDGTDIKISALKGKNVVVYFYPKDETPGCTKEACAFRDAWGDLAKTNVVLVGISTDTLADHKAFAEHHKLPFHLVSDADGAIAKSFGVEKRGPFLARDTIVIGPDGNVKKVYRGVKDPAGHAKEILGDVKS
jgi:thioredoxin-dependent peroxiredoxin